MTWHQQGQMQNALALYQRVLDVAPDNFPALFSLGTLFGQARRLEEAANYFAKAAAVEPKDFSAHFNLGMALEQLGRLEEALASYSNAAALKPDYANIYNNLGNVQKILHRYDNALANYDKALALNQNLADVHNNRGNLLIDLQRYEEALASYQKAIALKPDFAVAYYNLGNLFNKLGRHDEALSCYDKVIAIHPGYAAAYNNRGLILQEKFKRYDEALASFDKAISVQQTFVEAYYNRGVLLSEMGKLEDAVSSYDMAISLNPGNPIVYNNRGNALRGLQRHEESLSNFNKAIALKPDFAEAYYGRGVVFCDTGRINQAMDDYNKALSLRRDYPEANFNKGVFELLLGNFEEGWPLYEWRWVVNQQNLGKDYGGRTLWLGGQPLTGKTILVCPEQGLGDFIQFVRYVPLIEALGANVILEVYPALVPLIRTLKGAFKIITKGDALPDVDYYCPIMSLPLALKTTIGTIPNEVPYLSTSPQKQIEWQRRLGPKVKPRVGLVWAGSSFHKNDSNRSIPLRQLSSVLDLDIEFHSLQKEIRADDETILVKSSMHAHQQALSDFADTAALVAEMDLVIAVDTSVAHLAGAMAKPVWILLPYVPDYRWLWERNDSPWYPTARLFRQERLGDWAGVIDKVVAELKATL